MVVYSKRTGYPHSSIAAGALMLQEIAAAVGAEPPLVTEENAFVDSLDEYELVFFMNTSGTILSAEEKTKFEAWMKRGGAFCGTHSATDTEFGWPFYQEVIGQNFEGHGNAGIQDSIVFDDEAANHPAVRGLPNPWARVDEWMRFTKWGQWSVKPGFQILARRASDQQPIVWVREHDNYRSFYTGIGHDAAVFQDPAVVQHVTGGLLWAVRREHCLAFPKPPGCPSP
jgi:type 1 glutamine amidotransferase